MNCPKVPLLPTKYQCPSLVTPQKIINYMQSRGNLNAPPPASVVLFFSKGWVNQIKRQFQVTTLPFLGAELNRVSGEKSWTFLSHFGLGAPAVVAKLAELSAWGVKEFITIGTAGGMAPFLKIGDIVLVNQALRDEGTSYHYQRPEYQACAHKELVERITQRSKQKKIDLLVGKAWTTDAPYRETKEEVETRISQGVLTVDMETSAFYAAADYYQVSAVSLHIISDLLSAEKNSEWKPQFHHHSVKRGLEISTDLAVNILNRK